MLAVDRRDSSPETQETVTFRRLGTDEVAFEAPVKPTHTLVERFGRVEAVEIDLAPGVPVSPLEVTPES